MTQNQIAYQTLKENIRHNLATEGISSTSNAINREHYLRADTASLSQAASAKRNAETNAYNASINYMNAVSNQRQADAALRNASANERNAESNARNAATNAQNAQTNMFSAQTQARKVNIDASIAPSTIATNYGKADQSKAAAFKSTVDAYGSHPATAALVATGTVDKLATAGATVVGGIENFFTSEATGNTNFLGLGVLDLNRVDSKNTNGGHGRRHSGGRSKRTDQVWLSN